MASSSRTRDRFSIEFQQVEQSMIDREVLKECVDGVGNQTPEARQGVPNGRLIRVQLWSPPPPRDDYRATVRYIEYIISQLKNGIVSQQMVDSAKETVRRLRSKGYSSLDEDEAITLKDSIHFLGRLESTPSSFRERFLNFAEDIPSRVRCLRQMQETLIDQPNLVEQERQCIAEIQDRNLQELNYPNLQSVNPEVLTVKCSKANENIKLPLADNGGERQPEFVIFDDDDDVEICKKRKRREMEDLEEAYSIQTQLDAKVNDIEALNIKLEEINAGRERNKSEDQEDLTALRVHEKKINNRFKKMELAGKAQSEFDEFDQL
ncbi:hypothetical protein ABKV19_006951 [Rosa sericea]